MGCCGSDTGPIGGSLAKALVAPTHTDTPPAETGAVILYAKEVLGVDQLFARNPAGTEFQLTPPGGGGLTSGSVTSGFIGDAAVVSGSIASGSVGDFKLSSGAVRSGHIAAGGVPDGTKFLGDDYTWKTPAVAGLTSGAVQSGHVASGAVAGFYGPTRTIQSGTVGGFDLASGAVEAGTLGSGAARSGNIASGSVGGFHLASGAVKSGHIGDTAVVSGSLASGQIGWPKLASGAARSGHVGDAAVVSGSIASGQIDSPHFISGATITEAKGVLNPDLAPTEETVSGAVAVHLSQSGRLRVAMASVSGRMPAIGVLISGALSGSAATYRVIGDFQYSSGLADYSGYLGQPLFVGRSGQVVTASGSWNSGGLLSGDVWQQVGMAHLSGAAVVNVNPRGLVPAGAATLEAAPGGIAVAVRTGGLTSGGVQSGHLGSGTVQGFYGTTRHLASGTVGSFDHASGGVESGAYASGSVSHFKVAADTIRSGQAGSGAVLGQRGGGAFVIASGTIAPNDLSSGAVLSGHVGSGTVLGRAAGGAFTIASGSVAAPDLASGAVLSGHVGDTAVVSGSYASGSVSHFKVAADTIRSGQIGSGGVLGMAAGGARTIASGSVFRFDLASGAILSGHVGDAAVVSGSIASGSVGTPHIASGTQLDIAELLLDDNFITAELISGGKAVGFTSSGAVQIAMAAISGRMPAAAVMVDNTASGQPARLYHKGRVYSVLLNLSGYEGQPIFVGNSGELQGAQPDLSGSLVQAIGRGISASGCFVGDVLASGDVNRLRVASGAVTSGHISDTAVVSGSYASGSVSHFKVAADTIRSGQAGSGAVQGQRGGGAFVIASGTIAPNDLSSGAVVSGHVGSGSVLGSLGGGAFTVASGTVGPNDLGSGAVLSGAIASGQVGLNALASGSVRSGHIASGQVGNFKLASGAANSGHVGSGAVLGSLGGGAFTIASGTVGPNDLGSGSVLSGAVASGQIGTFHLSSGSVRSGAIASGQVGRFHLASGAVTSGHVGDTAVVSGSYASGSIGNFPLASGAVLSGHVGDGAVVSGSIASGQVTTPHIASGTMVTRAQFATPLASGGLVALTVEEPVSGGRAVCISQSGNLRIAMAAVSGRMPAIGVVTTSAASGIAVTVNAIGAIQFSSGMADYSGYVGQPVFVGRSGEIVTASGSWNSGGFVPGDVLQQLGVARNSGGALIEVNPRGLTPDGTVTINPAPGGLKIQGAAGALASGNVQSGHIASGAVQGFYGSTRHIASGTVGSFDHASGGVESGAYASGSISTFKLSSGAANSGHIGSGAVLGSLGGGAFTIASGTVGPNDLGSGSVLSGAIASGQVFDFHFASGARTDQAVAAVMTADAGEMISGGKAVAFFSGFVQRTRLRASVPPWFLWPAGIVVDEVLSGQKARVWHKGPVFAPVFNFVGSEGAVLYVGHSGDLGTVPSTDAVVPIGQIISASGVFLWGAGALSGDIGRERLQSGLIAASHIAINVVASAHLAGDTIYPRAKEMVEDNLVTVELISGLKAVAWASGGYPRICLAERQSGFRLPAIGVTYSGNVSGGVAQVVLRGRAGSTSSGMIASGFHGQGWLSKLYVGSGGLIVNLSGFMGGASSGAAWLSGSLRQVIGHAVSGGIFVWPQDVPMSGLQFSGPIGMW